MQYPSGRLITYAHDDAGRVTQARHESKVYAQGIGYAAHGSMTQMQLGNGLYEQWSYNGRLQPVAVRLGETLGSASKFGSVLGYSATANNGNIASQQIAGSGLNVTQSYGYDGLNRLTSATEGGGWSATYGYDRYGNGWVATWSGISPTSFTPAASSWFNGQNRLTGLSAAYDLAGNQVAIGAYGSSYDAENRLKTSTIDGATTEYFYDGDGRRIRKRLPGGAERLYVYDAMGQLAAEYSTAPEAVTGTHYLTADHLGSTRAVTMQNQQVVERRDYLPFGEEVPASIGGRTPLWAATPTQPHRFTGKERDAETGRDYFGARYLSAVQSRFTTVDPKNAGANPSNPQSWNGYSYALNNPLVYIDPNGKWPFYVHNRIYVQAFGGILDREQRQILQNASWKADFGPGSQEPGRSFTHSMCSPGQGLGDCTGQINDFLDDRLTAANRLSQGGRKLTREAIEAFGEAVHALTDMGSPAHVGPDGSPLPWGNGRIEGAAHIFAERSETVNWFRLGQSVRLGIAGFAQAFPELAKRQGNLDAWANRVIENYVRHYYQAPGSGRIPNPAIEDAARQCALGNPAACIP